MQIMARADRSRKRRSAPRPLGNHQSSWIWGRHLVLETLQAGCWPILELNVADDLSSKDLAAVNRSAEQANIAIRSIARKALTARCRGEDHQGFAARMAEFPYRSPDALFENKCRWPFYLLLDGIRDAFNFGTMLRSAEIFGVQGVVIGTREQTGVTSQVARSSVGAVNRIPIARVESLAAFAGSLEEQDIVVVGASEKGETTVTDFDFRRPIALVIGNEGHGISSDVAKKCGGWVRIPQLGTINSLNAAAAMAILCYEVRRQQATA